MQTRVGEAGQGSMTGTKALVIADDRLSGKLTRVAGITTFERALGAAREAGVSEFVIIGGSRSEELKACLKRNRAVRCGARFTFLELPEQGLGSGAAAARLSARFTEPFVLLIADRLFNPRILAAMLHADLTASVMIAIDRQTVQGDAGIVERAGKLTCVGAEPAVAGAVEIGLYRCAPSLFAHIEAAVAEGGTQIIDGIARAASRGDAETFDAARIDSYVPSVRKVIPPWWVRIEDPRDVHRAEKILIENASKGTNDLLATYLHKPIENFVVGKIADWPITPNQLSVAVNLLAYAVTALFALGLLLPASLLTFVVSIADGLDGKLARLRGQTSKLGSLEHSFDLLWEFSWLVALAWSTSRAMGSGLPLLLALLAVVFHSFCKHVYDVFLEGAGRSLDDSGRFERAFRRVAGRRNLFNLPILAFVLLGVPVYALYFIVAHAGITGVVYAWRAMSHLAALDRCQQDTLA
jgi:phosphatidylglycerophosphate synthase/choline kinase